MPIAGLLSAYLGGKAGDIQRNRLNSIADTPGLDIEALSAQALSNQAALLPGATQLVGSEATSRQALINQLLEQSLPGFTAQRDQALGTAGDFLSGEIPQDVSDLVQRSGAARALGGGYGGSGMHRNLVGRDLGLTSLSVKDKGLSWLSALRGMSPTATPQSAFSFMGPSSQELINLRGQERSQKMNTQALASQIGGQTAAWANYMAQQEGNFWGLANTAVGAVAGGGASGAMGSTAKSGGGGGPYGGGSSWG